MGIIGGLVLAIVLYAIVWLGLRAFDVWEWDRDNRHHHIGHGA